MDEPFDIEFDIEPPDFIVSDFIVSDEDMEPCEAPVIEPLSIELFDIELFDMEPPEDSCWPLAQTRPVMVNATIVAITNFFILTS